MAAESPRRLRPSPPSSSPLTAAANIAEEEDEGDDGTVSSRPQQSAEEAAAARSHNPCLWESLNALTLATSDMGESVAFYRKLGLTPHYGGRSSDAFSTMSPVGDYHAVQALHVNLFYSSDYERPRKKKKESKSESDGDDDEPWNGWGRCVVYVSDVDAMYQVVTGAGLTPQFSPRDAPWGERYFHIRDPMGHELSFAKRIEGHPRWNPG